MSQTAVDPLDDDSVVCAFPADRGRADGDPSVDLITFFDVSLDLLCIRELDGTVVKVSRSWQTTLGYGPDEIEGGPLLPLIHPEDLPGTLGSIVEVETRRPGDPVLGHVNRYRHKNGHYLILEWRAQRFGDRIYAVARDVTDRVAAHQALIEAKTAAEAANRAKSDFLANMSHEIRTPLNGVIGIVDALGRTGLTAEQREMVDLIQRSGTTLERLLSDILDVSRIEAGHLDIEARPFDLETEIDGVAAPARALAEDKGLAFTLDRGPTARGMFLGDVTRIRQVVTNLLSNAVKFTAEGEVRLRLDIRGDSVGPATLTLVVEDTGVGFHPDQAGHLFQRFIQADATITRRFGGTGLGLAICKSLVELMGGEIGARSERGKGSRFEVTLPLARLEPLAASDARALASGGGGMVPVSLARTGLRVLLAEDHPINQRVAQLILAGEGAEVVTVGDGAQALEAFRVGRFDLVLMDMQMPVMDGLAATRALRAEEATRPGGHRVPLIMLSANAMDHHRDEALAAGADRHVAKPITAASLLGGLVAVLGD